MARPGSTTYKAVLRQSRKLVAEKEALMALIVEIAERDNKYSEFDVGLASKMKEEQKV